MQAKDLIVLGSSRLLGKLYTNEISIGGSIETEGSLNVGKNTSANALLYLNNKLAIYGSSTWLRINDKSLQSSATIFSSGVYFGSSIVRTDGTLQVGNNGSTMAVSSSGGANFKTHTSITWAAGNSTYPYALSVTGKTNLLDTNITNLNANKIDVKNIDVADELRAAKYSIETVQNLGGHFLVCPTLEFPSDTTGISSPVAFKTWVKKNSDTQLQIIIQDQQLKKSGGGAVTYEGTQWNQYSKVKVVATINNTAIPTCNGYIASWNSASSQFTINVDVSNDIASKFSTTSTEYTASVENMTVMLYELCSNPTASESSRVFYPIGIFLTACGKNKYSAIDIYNGYNAQPVTRMGKLDGLPTVNGVNPTGWGFYSAKGSDPDHPGGGYFDGYLVAQNGLIGGFSIGEYTLKNGNPGSDGSIFMTTNFNETAVEIGGSPSALNTWRFGAGSKFGVTMDGTLYCSNAHVAGEITANSLTIVENADISGLIYAINSSEDSDSSGEIRINAGKVNIEGASIFNGDGRLSVDSMNDLEDKIKSKRSTYTLITDVSDTYSNLSESATDGNVATWTVQYTPDIINIAPGDTVRLQCNVSDMNNAPAYIIGTVFEVNADENTVRVESHGLDSTVIYGGNILANSISVQNIDMNSLQTAIARIGNLNSFHIEIDGEELGFYNNQTKVAYLRNNQLFINQSVTVKQTDVGLPIGMEDPTTHELGRGQWSWKVHANAYGQNNLNLKWMG